MSNEDELSSNPFGDSYIPEDDFTTLNLIDTPEELKTSSFHDGDSYGTIEIKDEEPLLPTSSRWENKEETKDDQEQSFYHKMKRVTDKALGMYRQAANSLDDGMTSKERELHQRETAIRQREADLGLGDRQPNWPISCYPVAYHDISVDIPENQRTLINSLYLCMLATWLCLLWNWLVILTAVFGGSAHVGADSDALWATIYLASGVPGSYRLWYRRAYNAARDNSGSSWLTFFLGFTFHTAFIVIMALGAPGTASGGLFFMFKMINRNMPLTSFLSLLCATVFGLNGAGSTLLLRRAHNRWKNGNGGGKGDLASSVANNLL